MVGRYGLSNMEYVCTKVGERKGPTGPMYVYEDRETWCVKNMSKLNWSLSSREIRPLGIDLSCIVSGLLHYGVNPRRALGLLLISCG